ncbi:MAG: hypothetical protein IKV00_08225, partial [Clostridia bacterium]|nr:hypothetical protein [Clostridia bacterium]
NRSYKLRVLPLSKAKSFPLFSGGASPSPTEFVRILNSPINQNLNDKLMFIGVLYFVVGEDIILPQRTITACFREADSLPYGVCANSKHTDKSKFEIVARFFFASRP